MSAGDAMSTGDAMSAGDAISAGDAMSAGCALTEFLRVGRPGRVPLRACCVAALLADGRGCPSWPVGRASIGDHEPADRHEAVTGRVPATEQAAL
ncbi:hypothetical protein OWR29_05265 [Actinoplanes sp. Pm04-4]|uniref:Uncharacterized protein n=1 Tax=Paractinoplanes pyxinae TaxID=2997416 RepID=A0ABT4AT30_9ACTN|nr:hypothetical protein [Actinoplanes pyxinae]MCY1137401.1 hypothetical protein [Actinoplanes pyxinae]